MNDEPVGAAPAPPAVLYAERLRVPLRWWVQGTLLVASFWLALIVAVPGWLPWAITGAAFTAMSLGFWSYAAEVVVTERELRAGPAHIALVHLGACTALDADQTRRVAGVKADARAYLVMRPYLRESVRVEITDPADPAPYWLVSTRHPAELTRALSRSGTATAR
jgi:Protein of unknown function (DUF3093)